MLANIGVLIRTVAMTSCQKLVNFRQNEKLSEHVILRILSNKKVDKFYNVQKALIERNCVEIIDAES